MTKAEVFGLVRHVLTFGGGFLVASDVIPADVLDEVVGALITIGGVIWSIINKQK